MRFGGQSQPLTLNHPRAGTLAGRALEAGPTGEAAPHILPASTGVRGVSPDLMMKLRGVATGVLGTPSQSHWVCPEASRPQTPVKK